MANKSNHPSKKGDSSRSIKATKQWLPDLKLLEKATDGEMGVHISSTKSHRLAPGNSWNYDSHLNFWNGSRATSNLTLAHHRRRCHGGGLLLLHPPPWRTRLRQLLCPRLANHHHHPIFFLAHSFIHRPVPQPPCSSCSTHFPSCEVIASIEKDRVYLVALESNTFDSASMKPS
jgi:hypothetical protein